MKAKLNKLKNYIRLLIYDWYNRNKRKRKYTKYMINTYIEQKENDPPLGVSSNSEIQTNIPLY